MIIPCKIGGVVTIGYEGENNAREYHFDITRYQRAWPDGRPQMLVTRSDGENYIADTVVDGTNLVWAVKRSDVACPGDGSMHIAFLNDTNELMGYTKKTTLVVEDMPEWLSGDTPPPAYESWIATILLAGDAARTGAAEAADSAATARNTVTAALIAQQKAENAEAAAEAAAEASAQSAAEAENHKLTALHAAEVAQTSAEAALLEMLEQLGLVETMRDGDGAALADADGAYLVM